MRRSHIPISSLLMAILMVGPLGLIFLPGTDVAAQGTSGTLTTTKEGWKELDLVWDSNVGQPVTMNLSLSKYWTIKNATIGVSARPYITDQGTPWEETRYPQYAYLDVGRNGDDWYWPGVFGHETYFANRSASEVLRFTAGVERTIYIPLPVGATISNITLDVNSKEQGKYDYSMTVGAGTTPVWTRSSISFSKGLSISTKTNQNYTPINSVCIEHIDFLSDQHVDIVGVGEGGALFVIRYNKDLVSGFPNLASPVYLGDGSQRAALLDCSVSDFNQDISNDLVVSSADGKVYVLQNDGQGVLQPVQTIVLNTSRVNSITMGDINMDGWGDLAAGYMAGQFYVSTYNNTKMKFSTPQEIATGQGSMNGVAIADVDLNGHNDLVGANENRNWYLVKNNGTALNKTIPMSCGNNVLTSLIVDDLNMDNEPDFISGSTDGSFYMAYNKGGTFDKGELIRAGSSTMKDIVTADLDLDGDRDLLGLNGDGWVYLSKNEDLDLADSIKLVEVGMDQSSIAVGDLDNDNDPDLVTGGKNGLTIYWNTRGPFEQTIGKGDDGALKAKVQEYLDNYKAREDEYDIYGNLIVNVPLKISSKYDATLSFKNVNVTYSFERKVDIRTSLQLYLKAWSEKSDHEGFIDVPIQFLTGSIGSLHIDDISIQYDAMMAAIIDSPIDNSSVDHTSLVSLGGHSNLDPGCNSSFYGFYWMLDGRIIGHGCRMALNGSDLGPPGVHELRFTVERKATKEQAYNTVIVVLIPPSPPKVTVKPKVTVYSGDIFHYKVEAEDPDPYDQANLTYSLDLGPPGMTMNNTTGELDWAFTRSDEGSHKVVVSVSDRKNVTTVSFFVSVRNPDRIGTPGYRNWVLIAVAVSICIAVGAVIAGTEVGLFALYSLAFLLYTRLKQEMVLDNFLRGQIYGHICENPGLHLSELRRRLELSNGTLVYHLKTLEREGLIRSYPNGGQRVFFSTKERVSKEMVHLTKAQRWVLKAIRERPGISQKEISEEIGLSDSTVNRIVHELEERGIVRMDKGRASSLFIVEETCVFVFPLDL